jgi:MFS family permease
MQTEASAKRLAGMTATQWAICAIACIGFLFDTFVLLVLTLIVQPSLTELLRAKPGSALFNHWIGMLFYVPAVAGGIFGLVGGYLIDRLGRRRVLLWSILLPAFSTFVTAYATSPLQLLLLRSLSFVGVSVEFVAATAWLAELFPPPAASS